MSKQKKMDLEKLPITTDKDAEILNDKQLETWSVVRKAFAQWLIERGKDPESLEGYSEYTTKDTLYRTDHFARYVWKEDTFRTTFQHAEADLYMEQILLDDDRSNSHASGTEKALKRYFKYRSNLDGEETKWNPKFNVKSPDDKRSIKDVFSEEEIQRIYTESLEYNNIPDYSSLTPEKRDQWKRYISMCLGKPKSEIVPDDWAKVDNWKIPSLVKVSIDAAFRPIEVERSKMQWLDLDNNRLIIPIEDSSKNRESWRVGLGEIATKSLQNWIEQRETMEKYEGRDEIWLTREGNPYSSSSLRHLVLNLCDEAGINTENRSVSWYSIRHATGSFFAKKGNVVQAQEQLRHTSKETTKKYVHSSSEDRSDINDKR